MIDPPDTRMEPVEALGHYLQDIDGRIKTQAVTEFMGQKTCCVFGIDRVHEIWRYLNVTAHQSPHKGLAHTFYLPDPGRVTYLVGREESVCYGLQIFGTR